MYKYAYNRKDASIRRIQALEKKEARTKDKKRIKKQGIRLPNG